MQETQRGRLGGETRHKGRLSRLAARLSDGHELSPTQRPVIGSLEMLVNA